MNEIKKQDLRIEVLTNISSDNTTVNVINIEKHQNHASECINNMGKQIFYMQFCF